MGLVMSQNSTSAPNIDNKCILLCHKSYAILYVLNVLITAIYSLLLDIPVSCTQLYIKCSLNPYECHVQNNASQILKRYIIMQQTKTYTFANFGFECEKVLN